MQERAGLIFTMLHSLKMLWAKAPLLKFVVVQATAITSFVQNINPVI